MNQDAGSMPLYSQIKQIIPEWILRTGYIGSMKRYLQKKQLRKFRCQPAMTIRLAIDALVAEGYVVKERSKGTRVFIQNYGESE